MCGVLLILQLGLLLLSGVAFTESSEMSVDLNCLNDYETEMRCHLTPQQLSSCSEYNLNVSIEKIKDGIYACSFEEMFPGTCRCTLKAHFNAGEIFKVKVLRGGNVLFTKHIPIAETIKPKQPVIASVDQTELGNYLITLNSTYSGFVQKRFSESLTPELTYSVERRAGNVTKLLGKGQSKYEIVGSNLYPNSNYIMRARMKSDYSQNLGFSDYSEPVRFTTSSPSHNSLKTVIPILCVILVICISTVFYCYNKIRKVWWDKIPTPKLATNFVKKVPQLQIFQNEFSPVCIDSSNLDHTAKTTRIAPPEGVPRRLRLEKQVELPEADCAQTGFTSLQEAQDSGIGTEESETVYTGLYFSSGVSSFSNRVYSTSDGSFTSYQVTHQTRYCNQMENFPLEALDPVTPADFDSGTCNAFESTSPVFCSEMVLDPEYQSVGQIMDHGCEDLIMEMLKGIKTAEEVSPCGWDLVPVVDGYQDFQSVS